MYPGFSKQLGHRVLDVLDPHSTQGDKDVERERISFGESG
jgi:hypothetical protein